MRYDPGRTQGHAFAISAVLLLLLPSICPLALASSGGPGDDAGDDAGPWKVTVHGTKLPMELYRSSAVWTGNKAYIFTGRVEAGPVDTVVEFDPSSGKATVKDAKVPRARIMSTAAWLSPYAYIFGGANYSDILDEVLRYDPVTDAIEVLPYRIPVPVMGASAVTVGGSIFLIGGRNLTEHHAKAYRFRPDDGSFVELPDMPVTGGGRTAVTDGKMVYLFGGCGSSGNDTAFDLDPTTGVSRLLDTQLDYGYYWTTGVWTGGSALVFGGNDFKTTIDHFIEFVPDGEGGGRLKDIGKLPKPLELATSVFDEGSGKAYIFGGRSTEDPSDKIYVVQREKGGDRVSTTPDKILFVVILMVFTVIIVYLQATSGWKSKLPAGEDEEKEDEVEEK